jgi:excisionase family DNA binding protein
MFCAIVPTWRTLNEAAKLTGVSRRTLQHWAKQGHIRIYVRPGERKHYVDLDEIETYRQMRPRDEGKR